MGVRIPPPALPVFARDRYWRSDLGCAVGPGLRPLELTRDAEQDVFATVGGDELYADRQALGCPLQWEADRRLAAGVERRSERHELAGTTHRRHRLIGVVDDRAELDRQLAERRREQQIPAVVPPRLQRPA